MQSLFCQWRWTVWTFMSNNWFKCTLIDSYYSLTYSVSLSPPRLFVFSLNPGNIQTDHAHTHSLRLNIQFTFMSIVPNHNISGKLKVQDLKVSLRKTQWNTWKKQGNIDLNVTRLIRGTPPPYTVNFFIFIKAKKGWSPSIFGILAVQKLQHNVGISCTESHCCKHCSHSPRGDAGLISTGDDLMSKRTTDLNPVPTAWLTLTPQSIFPLNFSPSPSLKFIFYTKVVMAALQTDATSFIPGGPPLPSMHIILI